MATIRIPSKGQLAEDRTIIGATEVGHFLTSQGIRYEHWEVEGRVGKDATDEEILAAYEPEIKRLKHEHGFVTADVINVSPETPNLDEMAQKFNKEHTHDEDEVRFVVHGTGLFHIHPANAPVFAIEVESGDLINVPKGARHWFDFCQDRTIRCIRLFKYKSGWTPRYIEDGAHEEYAPLCMGPAYFSMRDSQEKLAIEPVVEL